MDLVSSLPVSGIAYLSVEIRGWEQGFHNTRLLHNNKRIPLYLATDIGMSAGCHLKLIVGSLEKGVFSRDLSILRNTKRNRMLHMLVITQSPVTPKLSCLQPWDYSLIAAAKGLTNGCNDTGIFISRALINKLLRAPISIPIEIDIARSSPSTRSRSIKMIKALARDKVASLRRFTG
jgi:hypothetical protein